MSSEKHLFWAWLTYMIALCGIAGFYVDSRTGRVIKSRYLCFYSRLMSLVVVTTFPIMMNRYWFNSPGFLTQSKLVCLLTIAYPTLAIISVISCIFCAQLWQHKIIQLIENLIKIEELIIEINNCLTSSQQRYLRGLFWIKFCLLLPRIVEVFFRMLLRSKEHFFYFGTFVVVLIRSGLYFLIFTFIWQICIFLLKLQRYLDQLLQDQMLMPNMVQKILEFQRMYFRLIHMINELCIIFKYPLVTCIIHLTCTACLSGYSTVRILLGKPQILILTHTDWFLTALTVVDVLEFYGLASIAQLAGTLHESTCNSLRYPYPTVDLLERCNEWLALQLTWQNKNVNIFGILTINHHLIFLILHGIVLHVTYMVQSDYDYMEI